MRADFFLIAKSPTSGFRFRIAPPEPDDGKFLVALRNLSSKATLEGACSQLPEYKGFHVYYQKILLEVENQRLTDNEGRQLSIIAGIVAKIWEYNHEDIEKALVASFLLRKKELIKYGIEVWGLDKTSEERKSWPTSIEDPMTKQQHIFKMKDVFNAAAGRVFGVLRKYKFILMLLIALVSYKMLAPVIAQLSRNESGAIISVKKWTEIQKEVKMLHSAKRNLLTKIEGLEKRIDFVGERLKRVEEGTDSNKESIGVALDTEILVLASPKTLEDSQVKARYFEEIGISDVLIAKVSGFKRFKVFISCENHFLCVKTEKAVDDFFYWSLGRYCRNGSAYIDKSYRDYIKVMCKTE